MQASTATWPRASITCRERRPEAEISLFTRVLFAAYFIEAGLILVVAPWSAFWEYNVFASYVPAIRLALDSALVRMAVSAVGAITALAGLAEVGGLVGARRPPPPDATPIPPAPADH